MRHLRPRRRAYRWRMTTRTILSLLLGLLALPGHEVRAGLRAQQPMLCLGDSYTVGEGVAPSERWPERLGQALARRGELVGPPQVIARTGWTTDDLLAALDGAAPAGPRPLVTLLVGVNDQYRGRSAESYRASFRRVLARAVSVAGSASRVVVLSVPDWGVSPFGAHRDRARIAREIDAYNAVNRAETARAGAQWVDVTEPTRAAGADPTAYAADGLHPSPALYDRWLSRLTAALN